MSKNEILIRKKNGCDKFSKLTKQTKFNENRKVGKTKEGNWKGKNIRFCRCEFYSCCFFFTYRLSMTHYISILVLLIWYIRMYQKYFHFLQTFTRKLISCTNLKTDSIHVYDTSSNWRFFINVWVTSKSSKSPELF